MSGLASRCAEASSTRPLAPTRSPRAQPHRRLLDHFGDDTPADGRLLRRVLAGLHRPRVHPPGAARPSSRSTRCSSAGPPVGTVAPRGRRQHTRSPARRWLMELGSTCTMRAFATIPGGLWRTAIPADRQALRLDLHPRQARCPAGPPRRPRAASQARGLAQRTNGRVH
jgi:hypothetical protein